jgi:hypothetical protein
MPGELVGLAYIAHSDEALLAALAIFIWHFYNTHLRPMVFPMSRVWLSGRISAEALYEEHRLEYERQFGPVPPGPASLAPTWHRHPRWSFVALALTLVGGLAVVVLDVSSVRQQLGTMTQRGIEYASAGAPAAMVNRVAGVYDDGFDVFERCFECHARTRYDLAEGHFPHTPHFEAGFVEPSCDSCHEAAWHDRLVTSTEVCVMCHEPGEIGLQLVSGGAGNGGR